MPTAEAVITKALRKARVIGELHEPTGYDLESGLESLQNLYHGWIHGGMFGRATDVQADGDYTVTGENVRIRRNGVTAGTITVPDEFEDETGENDYRTPRDLGFVIYADPILGTDVTLLYTAYAGGWTQVSDLALTTEAPLSERGDGLACCLAEAIAEERGGTVGPLTQRNAALFRSSLAMRWNSPRQTVETEYF